MPTTQAAQQPAKPTDAQVQLQIETTHWQEKQQEVTAAFIRQQQITQIGMQQAQMRIEHEHYMVDHLATPLVSVTGLAIVAFTVVYLVRKAIEAGVQKNRDDNESNVKYAEHLIEKSEASE